MSGLTIIAALNVVLGVLIFILSYRLFALRAHVSKRISELQERISRVEVVMKLSVTKPEKVPLGGIPVLEDHARTGRSLAVSGNPKRAAGASGSGQQT